MCGLRWKTVVLSYLRLMFQQFKIKMSSVQNLREFINERLTAAAKEIFTEFEKTIVQYEEEIDRQRRLLEITWKPQIKLHRIDFPRQLVHKEQKVLADQQLYNQERNFSLDQKDQELPQIEEEQENLCSSLDQEDPQCPQIKEEQENLCSSLDKACGELPQIKEELERQEEFCTSQNGEPLLPKLETYTFMATPNYEDHSKPEPNRDQLLSYNPPVPECPVKDISKHVDSTITRNAKLKPNKKLRRNRTRSRRKADNSPTSESHCDTDTAKKSVTCDVCGKAFKHQYKMKSHYRIHTGEKPYLCNTCGKTFRHLSTLTRHTTIHTDERPYCCKCCRKCFRQSCDLKVHMRTHTGEKPYICNTCGQRFSHISTLQRHTAIKGQVKVVYSCSTCGKSFSRNGCLKVHMRTHTGEKSGPET